MKDLDTRGAQFPPGFSAVVFTLPSEQSSPTQFKLCLSLWFCLDQEYPCNTRCYPAPEHKGVKEKGYRSKAYLVLPPDC